MNTLRTKYGQLKHLILPLGISIILVFTLMTPATSHAKAIPESTMHKNPINSVFQETEEIDFEALYQHSLTFLARQGTAIVKALDFAENAETKIGELAEQGVETSTLEGALSTFYAGIDIAREYHETAEVILAWHAGFDDDGNVTSEIMALETLQKSNENMQECRQILEKASQAAREAMKEYRQMIPPDPEQYEGIFSNLTQSLERINAIFERADEFTIKAEERLAELEGEGKDTTRGEEILGKFVEAIDNAHQLYDQASLILDTHAGFDEDGSVIDETLALDTITNAGENLRSCREILSISIERLRAILDRYQGSSTEEIENT